MGLKFNPPPGWPLPYDFEPWPGWEPDQAWPAPPPGWPLWIGSSAPSIVHDDPRLSYAGRHSRGLYVSPDDRQTGRRHQGESRAHGTERRSPGLARRFRPSVLASVTAGTLGIVAIAVLAIVAYRQVPGGPVTRQRTVSFSSLRPGECFQNPPGGQLSGGQPADVITVGCTTAHSAQLLAEFALTDQRAYPGRRALARRSGEDCQAAVTAVQHSDARGKARVLKLFPDAPAWRHGFRTISCVVVGTARDLTHSLAPKADRNGSRSSRRSGPSRHSSASSHRPGGPPHHHGKSGRP